MTACIVIMLFVFYEKSFDNVHTKNVYRLDEVQKFEGMVAPQNVALSMFPMGPTLKNEFPEVLNFTRIRNMDKVKLRVDDKKFSLASGYFVDSTFLQIFDYKLVKGDKNQVLQKPNSVVLSEESAAKIFGNEDAIGKIITVYGGDTTRFTVTGILENIPKTSHLQFDGLFSFNTIIKPENMENWGGNWLVTYLELSKNANVASMEKRFPDYLKRHMKEGGWKYYQFFLQSLKDVHANSMNITHDYLNYQKFDKTYTYVFSFVAIIVLLIACINFMNLSTARSAGQGQGNWYQKSQWFRSFSVGNAVSGRIGDVMFFLADSGYSFCGIVASLC